jgi:DNA-binding response OmpR family regulator
MTGDFEKDYVTKPFSPRELRARIKAAPRRTEYRLDG